MAPITFWLTDECVKKEGNTWKIDFKNLWDHPHLTCQRLKDFETLLIREALDKEDVTKVKEYTITCNLRAKLAEGYKNGTFKPYMAKDQSDFQKKSGTTTLTRTSRGGYYKDDMKDDKEAYQEYKDSFGKESKYDRYAFGDYFGSKSGQHRKLVKIDTEYKEIKTTTPSRTFWGLLFAYPLNSRLKEVYDERTPDMAVLSKIQNRLNSNRGRAAYIAEQFLDPNLLTMEYTPDLEIKNILSDIMSTLHKVLIYPKDWEKEWSRKSEYKIKDRETYDKYNILLINIFKDRCLKTEQSGSYFWKGMYELYKERAVKLRKEDWKSIFFKYPIIPKDFMNEKIFQRYGSELWATVKEALKDYDCWKEHDWGFLGWSISKDKKCKGRLLKL